MTDIAGVYLSGTGNTRYCMETLLHRIDAAAPLVPLEDGRAVDAVRDAARIYLGYPTQYSNAPLMVRDFIREHRDLWKGKHVVCVVTMGAFSGDGAGCTARLLKKYGAVIDGGLHLHMPDSVCDSKALKKTREENHQIVLDAGRKIEKTATGILEGKYPRDGLGLLSHLAGLFGQRLWFYGKTQHYSDKLHIDRDACLGCGTCAKLCPMENIVMKDGKASPGARCTMCYRCVSHCPAKAITLIGRQVVEQCRIENYL